MIISCKYKDLIKFLFAPKYIEVDALPFFDRFFLIKNLTGDEYRYLERQGLSDYLIVSDSYSTEWGRAEIVEYLQTKHKKKIKDFDQLSDSDFEQAAKIYSVCGHWQKSEEPEGIFVLYQSIDSFTRYSTYFELLKSGLQPFQIFYSLLTFVRRCYDENTKFEVSPAYLRVIQSKSAIVKQNFVKALKLYRDLQSTEEARVLYFISVLGARDGAL